MTFTQRFSNEIIAAVRLFLNQPEDVPVFFPKGNENRLLVGGIVLHGMIRSAKFFSMRDEFTLRVWAKTPGSRMLERILNGYAEYYFYGIQHPDDPLRLIAIIIIDLDVFRRHHPKVLAEVKGNKKGSTGFHVFRYDQFPPGLIVGRVDFQSRLSA